MAHGSIGAAAIAEGLTYRTIEASLRDARKKAGVHTTPALVELYQQHQAVAA
jgi:DNA-binding CsgD family transcriptional regulator